MVDYIKEISDTKKRYAKAWCKFSDALDKWEEKHEDMGNFTLGLRYNDKKEVYLNFNDTDVNMDIVNKVCEDFNLRIMEKITSENFYHGSLHVSFRLRHKDKPYGL